MGKENEREELIRIIKSNSVLADAIVEIIKAIVQDRIQINPTKTASRAEKAAALILDEK